ncbi:unnamed protein product [Moneuplotes crassus]|uniref:Uncharacterized protein n=1 Tax=Euplotes crassus TaxID=5936 RepID=A0AAD1UFE4_EUPCR|nr:unnamed protein product [Moneuplotes crassus]
MGSCCSDKKVQLYETRFDVDKKTSSNIVKKGEVSQFSQKFQEPEVEGYIHQHERQQEYLFFKSIARKEPSEFPCQVVESNIPTRENAKTKPRNMKKQDEDVSTRVDTKEKKEYQESEPIIEEFDLSNSNEESIQPVHGQNNVKQHKLKGDKVGEKVEVKRKNKKSQFKSRNGSKEQFGIKPKSRNNMISRHQTDPGSDDIFKARQKGQFDSRMLSPFRMNNTSIQDTSPTPIRTNNDQYCLPSKVTFIPY